MTYTLIFFLCINTIKFKAECERFFKKCCEDKNTDLEDFYFRLINWQETINYFSISPHENFPPFKKDATGD